MLRHFAINIQPPSIFATISNVRITLLRYLILFTERNFLFQAIDKQVQNHSTADINR